MKVLELQTTSVPEWDDEEETAGALTDGTLVNADEDEAFGMFEQMQFSLPNNIEWTELVGYAKTRKTPFKLTISPDKDYSYYLIEIPLNIMMIKQRLVRLRLKLRLAVSGRDHKDIEAYDLFPTDQVDTKTIMSGQANLDISPALKFALTAIGGPAAIPFTPLIECLGLKLSLPFKWKSSHARVQTSDRMSNPVEWYVADESIQNGFTGYAIIRAPKKSKVYVTATLVGEVRKSGFLGRILRAQFKTAEPNTYTFNG